jgi:hypothetical protein
MTKLISGVKALAIIAAVSLLAACGTTSGMGPMTSVNRAAAQPLPPLEASPEAVTWQFMDTMNFHVQIDDGFDDDGRLRTRTQMTWGEASAVAQISNACATGIQTQVEGVGWQVLKRTIRGGTAQTLGSVVSTAIGFEAPTPDLYRQVVGLTTGTAFFASWDAADFQLFMILSAAHAQCVNDRVRKNYRVTGSLIIVMTPTLRGSAPQPTAPGVEAPVPD